MDYKLKIITGFREDQEYTIDAEEAHKAYYLFKHPDERGVFNSGLAIRGKDIERIVPDYHATMGWNKGHKMNEYDWLDIKYNGVEKKMKQLMYDAQTLSKIPEALKMKLTEAKDKFLLTSGK
jgi:hypothetical protein